MTESTKPASKNTGTSADTKPDKGKANVAYVSAGTEPGAVMTVHYDDGSLQHWRGAGS